MNEATNTIDILLLGSGGREHALAVKLAQSPRCGKLYIAPGNGGTVAVGENVAGQIASVLAPRPWRTSRARRAAASW